MKIGIDIGGSHIAVGLVNKRYELIAKKDISLKELRTNESIEKKIENTIVNFIKELLKENNEKEENIEVIGIGTPGTVKDGVIYNAVNLGLDGFDIKNMIAGYFNTKIYVQNDCKCSGICEKELGSLNGYEDSVFIAIGTGIGGAVFLNNNMLIPKRYSGFEFGHMIINKNGYNCKCGNKGCFEVYNSMKKFKKDIIDIFKLDENIHGKEIYEFIKENKNNIKMQKFLEEYICNLSIGLANIINIFEPQAISLGGSFAYFGDLLLDKLKENLKDKLFNNSCPELYIAKYHNDAGIIGATMLDKYDKKQYNIK
ncbi:MAG: ROK family protein [Clostridia bacterium]|nr:ROK family protein [Clostridia bacterium]